MLPDTYTFALTAEQNYFGDTFDPQAFTERAASRLVPDDGSYRPHVATIAGNQLRQITGQVDEMVARDVSGVDEALTALYEQTEADSTDEAIEAYLQKCGDTRRHAVDSRRLVLAVRAGMLLNLQIERQGEVMLTALARASKNIAADE